MPQHVCSLNRFWWWLYYIALYYKVEVCHINRKLITLNFTWPSLFHDRIKTKRYGCTSKIKFDSFQWYVSKMFSNWPQPPKIVPTWGLSIYVSIVWILTSLLKWFCLELQTCSVSYKKSTLPINICHIEFH